MKWSKLFSIDKRLRISINLFTKLHRPFGLIASIVNWNWSQFFHYSRNISAFFCMTCVNPLHSQTINTELYHVWAQCSDGTAYRWGYNANGNLGTGNTTNSSTPILLTNPTAVTKNAPSGDNTLLLKSNGTVWACGNNTYGQIGIGNTTNQLSFVQVNTITNAVAVAGGYDGSYALTSTGQVYSWGENTSGSVGDGTTTNRTNPVLLGGLSGITAIDGSTDNGYALKNNGTVWAWGQNSYGQIGNGVTGANVLSPVQVSGLTNVIAISSNGYHCLALKNDGTVWAWGYNSNGQLGDGTTSNRNVPVQVSGLTNVASISAGYMHSLAVKNNGTVSVWGQNNFGQLGDGTTIGRLVPVQATSLTGIVTSVSAGIYSSYAVKNDGTMWSWGWNIFGQLGDGTTTNRLTPVQIPIICAVPLPIELLHFSAICTINSIKVNWSTASETNNDYFLLERSSDGISFVPIQTIDGAGNSSHELDYHFIDNSVLSNQIYYYRLSQTDYNGQKEYFDVISAQACANDNDITFVNPTNGLLMFHFSRPNLTAAYSVINNLGQIVLSGDLSMSQNTIDLSCFSNGVYYLHLIIGEKDRQEKIILQH